MNNPPPRPQVRAARIVTTRDIVTSPAFWAATAIQLGAVGALGYLGWTFLRRRGAKGSR